MRGARRRRVTRLPALGLLKRQHDALLYIGRFRFRESGYRRPGPFRSRLYVGPGGLRRFPRHVTNVMSLISVINDIGMTRIRTTQNTVLWNIAIAPDGCHPVC